MICQLHRKQETDPSVIDTQTRSNSDLYLQVLTQRGDDVAQGDQRLVDVSSLFQSDARRSGGVGSFAAGQIDQVDLTDRLTGHLRIELSLKETDRRR